jgi:hypothetical protein
MSYKKTKEASHANKEEKAPRKKEKEVVCQKRRKASAESKK